MQARLLLTGCCRIVGWPSRAAVAADRGQGGDRRLHAALRISGVAGERAAGLPGSLAAALLPAGADRPDVHRLVRLPLPRDQGSLMRGRISAAHAPRAESAAARSPSALVGGLVCLRGQPVRGGPAWPCATWVEDRPRVRRRRRFAGHARGAGDAHRGREGTRRTSPPRPPLCARAADAARRACAQRAIMDEKK
eukprot:scaffold1348_cov323-Prasinococcus_capsulatus_cf.AAC.1